MISQYNGKIRISNFCLDPEGKDIRNNEQINKEFIEIQNISDQTIDISEWILHDDVSHNYTFPTHVSGDKPLKLKKDEIARVHTGKGTDKYILDAFDSYIDKPGKFHLFQDREYYVWNNDGDFATLKDDDNKIVHEKKL